MMLYCYITQVENDDGIWLKLSKDSGKKYCDAEVESWTLAVAVSGRIYLAQDGDSTYQSQVVDTSAPPTLSQPAFPTAASVFGTAPQIFATPLIPPAPMFQFGSPKLQFGGPPPLPPKAPLFKFGLVEKPKKRRAVPVAGRPRWRALRHRSGKSSPSKPGVVKGDADADAETDDKAQQPPKRVEVDEGERDDEKTPSPSQAVPEDEEEDDDEEKSGVEADETPLPIISAPPAESPPKKALSPAVAECQRAVYAAFLWQEGLVHDAIVSASYLKFHPELSKDMKRSEQKSAPEKEDKVPDTKEETKEAVVQTEATAATQQESGVEEASEKEDGKEGGSELEGNEAEEKPEAANKAPKTLSLERGSQLEEPSPSSLSLPATLNHLVTFWDEISCKVLDSASAAFPPPKVPSIAQELQKRYEEEKKEIEKRKKEKDNKASVPAEGGGGTTVCELCEQSFPDPVTYHMKDIHPGCGKHASGWGYNSRGTFCSGWAGNCGDGGRGGSTWYLMCKDCHTKYLAMKNEVKKKVVRAVPLPKMKTKKPGRPRSLPVVSVVQGMIQNSKFLLEISCLADSKPATTPTAVHSPGLLTFSKQASFPSKPTEMEPKKPTHAESVSSEHLGAAQRPGFLRSVSQAAPTSPLTASSSSDLFQPTRGGGTREEGLLLRQRTLESPAASSTLHAMGALVFKPSINLARLIYNRSKQSADSKEVVYGKVMAFVMQYHDLNGLRAAMKQSMRTAGVRAFAMEVGETQFFVYCLWVVVACRIQPLFFLEV